MSKRAFDIIYQILDRLEEAMDEEEFDWREIGYEQLGISERKWVLIIEMMLEQHLMTGISIQRGARGETMTSIHGPRITLNGLLYLSENSKTSKFINAAKMLKEIIPGI